MLNLKAELEMKKELANAKNFGQFIDTLCKYYDADGTELGVVTRAGLIIKLPDMMKKIKAKPQRQYL